MLFSKCDREFFEGRYKSAHLVGIEGISKRRTIPKTD